MGDARGDAYPGEVWRRYLNLLDRELTEPRELIVIGGAALALKHDPGYRTVDLDTVTSISGAFGEAAEHAGVRLQQELHLQRPPPVSSCPVLDAPYSYEERLERVEVEGLQQLRVFVPEVHDLALMKTSRYSPRDADALGDLHRLSPFDLPTLVERYGEMETTGPRERFRTSFYLLTERLYGTNTARALEPHLELVDSMVGGGTIEERRALAKDAQWLGALQDTTADLRRRAAVIGERAREGIATVRGHLQGHIGRKPRAPSALDLLRGKREDKAATRTAWEHERGRLRRRLQQLEGRERLAQDLTLNPVRAGDLARERAARRFPELARTLEQRGTVVRALQERQREHEAERGTRGPQFQHGE